MASRHKRNEQSHAAREVAELFAHAAAATQQWADRYVAKARRLASRSRISLRRYNRQHCRKCSAYFTAATLRVRTRTASVVYTCLRCGHITRLQKK